MLVDTSVEQMVVRTVENLAEHWARIAAARWAVQTVEMWAAATAVASVGVLVVRLEQKSVQLTGSKLVLWLDLPSAQRSRWTHSRKL